MGVEGRITAELDDRIRNMQPALYARLLTELTGSGAANAANRQLGGTKGWLSSYVSLLLPRTVEGNEYVTSLLAGDQSILGDAEAAALYASAQTAPILDMTQKVDFTVAAIDRITALQDVLTSILRKVANKETTARLDLIAEMLDEIELYNAGVALRNCTYTVTPARLTLPTAGGRMSFTVATEPACPWVVFDLPPWANATVMGPRAAAVPIDVDLNRSTVTRTVTVTVAGQAVEIAQAGGMNRAGHDFTGDHKRDLLWRHESLGELRLWQMDGAANTAQSHVLTVADMNWEIRGLGAQTGDGKADLLCATKCRARSTSGR